MSRPFDRACPVCLGELVEPVLTMRAAPVFCNVLLPSPEEARQALTADIALVQCASCSLLYNRSFDPEVAAYAPGYENALHHSATFRAFSEQLVEHFATTLDLAGGTVVEIGAGGGDFLAALCGRTGARGIGFDPSRERDVDDGVVAVRARPFPVDGEIDAELIVTRHVLEHLDEPRAVTAAVGRALERRRDARFYAEVPDGRYLLEHVALWDVIYEHCTHFTAPALMTLLADARMSTERIGSSFGGQYLWADAAHAASPDDIRRPDREELDELLQLGARLADSVERQLATWEDRFATFAEKGPFAVWGIGSKGVSLLNLLPSAQAARWTVDLNPRKHGLYVPVVGHEVVAPERLREDPPSTVVVMNPLYATEVSATVEALGINADIVVPTAA